MSERKSDQKFEIDHFDNFNVIQGQLRRCPLNGVPNMFPYRNSVITLETMDPNHLNPCALYVLKENIDRTINLRGHFLSQGIDILAMTADQAAIEYIYEGQPYRISPPMIEMSEDDGNIPIVTDGLHRVWLARSIGMPVNVLKIQNIAAPIPALPVSWDEVNIVDKVPPTSEKRKFRFNSPEETQAWFNKPANYMRFLEGFENSITRAAYSHVRVKGK